MWNIDDYQNLHKRGQEIIQHLNIVNNTLEESSLPADSLINDVTDINIPRVLTDLRPLLPKFTKDVFRKWRKPAKDVLAILISESTRRRKPYALPVQCIPHAGLGDEKLREFADEIKKEMGMKPRGM